MIPNPARSGDRVSANFLNWLRNDALAENGIRHGFEDLGTHNSQIGSTSKCNFVAATELEIPVFSVFGIVDYADSPYNKVAYASDAGNNALFTNQNYAVGVNQQFRPTPINTFNLYKLQVNMSNQPAAGDFAKPTTGDFSVEKGGASFLCLSAATVDEEWGLFLALPIGPGRQRIGFIINNDIAPNSAGEVELYDDNYVANGTILQVYNSHNVTFHEENTTSGEEYPADKVIVFEVAGWNLPLIFPWMLSACEDLAPTFDPVDV